MKRNVTPMIVMVWKAFVREQVQEVQHTCSIFSSVEPDVIINGKKVDQKANPESFR
jgi:hypothetical protein